MARLLELSSPALLADWLDEPVTPRLIESLDAARAVLSERISLRVTGAGDAPEALHRAATMLAARLHRRQRSVYGVDAFAVGGDEAPGFLLHDPTIAELISPWRRPDVGAAPPPGA